MQKLTNDWPQQKLTNIWPQQKLTNVWSQAHVMVSDAAVAGDVSQRSRLEENTL